jgi:hypothetical protein
MKNTQYESPIQALLETLESNFANTVNPKGSLEIEQLVVDGFLAHQARKEKSTMNMKMETENNKHNGWTNYATWRVNLEIFDALDPEGQEVDHEWCKEFAEGIIFSVGNVDVISLVGSYASAFISDVNWHEIAKHLNEQ